jgi:hypothetical protein
MSRRFRLAALGVGLLGALTASLLFATLSGESNAKKPTRAQLIKQLKNQLTPGHRVFEAGGEANGPAQEDYDNRAYPATRVALAQVLKAQRAATRIKSKAPAPAIGLWQPVGPSTLNVGSLGTQTYGPPTQWSGRVTALAVGKPCKPSGCVLYLAAAGGGIWRTPDALATSPKWKQISDGGIPSNAIGSMLVDPNDPTGKTIYAGTGEPNGSSDSEAGIGLYKSTDGGQTWNLVGNSDVVAGDRGIGSIAVDPTNANHLLIGTDVARHGLSSNSGGRFTPPAAPTIGLYESTNGGATWSLLFNQPQDPVDPATVNGSDFFRGGVTKIEYDPNNSSTFYFSMFGYGLYRSTGGTIVQIFQDDREPDTFGIRFEFATADLGATTRVYLGAGWNQGDGAYGASRLYRNNNAGALAADGGTHASWTDMSSDNNADPGWGSYNWCQAQCSYDMFVASPPGQPGVVILGGSMHYAELDLYGGDGFDDGYDYSNGRAVIMSVNGGVSWTDLTGDATKRKGGYLFKYEDMHPDQHAIAFVPKAPGIAFVGSDGGVIRTSGEYVDNSKDCYTPARDLSGQDLTNCLQFLSAIPKKLIPLNAGLNTLQFQSLSVDPNAPLTHLLGGTQDNGTLSFTGPLGSTNWYLGITGDGGDSTINPATGNVITHTYTNTYTDTNFHGDTQETWVWTGDGMAFSGEDSGFYAPMISDPVSPGTIFAGMRHVWRTFDSGGSQAFLEAHCNTTFLFGTSDEVFSGNCGDYVPLGAAGLDSAGDLGGTTYGTDKQGTSGGERYAVALGRTPDDSSTLWAGTRRGRVFISLNADAPDETDVLWYRIDEPAPFGTTNRPTRLPSSITVDPNDPFHAWVTYSGYDAYATAAGTATGHIFEVTVDDSSCSNATHGCDTTWTLLDSNLGDQPVLDSLFDSDTGDLYVSTDWGVYVLPNGDSTFYLAAPGLPPSAAYGLSIVRNPADNTRVIYAATHGRGAWRLVLPAAGP